MLPVAMLLIGLPVGLLCRSRRQALLVLLSTFVALLIIQTVVVGLSSNNGLPVTYWLVQLGGLLVGLLLMGLGIALRGRRRPA